MNLGISLETGSANPSNTELGSATGTQVSSAGQAGAVFGQLMAKALQQHGRGQGQSPEQADQEQQDPATALLANDASPADASLQAVSPTDAPAPGHSDDALAQFNALWMSGASQTLTLPSTPGVKSVSVGPSIQAITASSPAPDASSLTAFAHQQGLDAQAIAWLMNPQAQATNSAASGTATALAGTTSGLPTGGLPPGMAGDVLPGMAPASGSTPVGFGMPASTGMLPVAATAIDTLPTASVEAPMGPATALASTLPALGADTSAKLSSAGQPQANLATALAAAVPVVQAILSGPQARTPVPTNATDTPTPSELTELSALTMAQMRWGGVKTRGTGQADNAPPAPATSTATPTLWAQSDLDLSGLDLSLLPSSKDNPALDSTTGESTAAADTTALASVALSGSSRMDTQAAQARQAATNTNPTSSSTSSDQMQQLSEKMADAVGERILREIERGQWNLRLMLKPAHLGHIEVEMRLRAGQLDASFVAPQAATRELLQDGLDRLRQQLDQSGMDVANLHVKDGQTRQNGGDSTPGQRQFGNTAKNTETPQAPAPSVQSLPRPSRPDGWDVTV
jgi:flagellar hook-length control protein FliK